MFIIFGMGHRVDDQGIRYAWENQRSGTECCAIEGKLGLTDGNGDAIIRYADFVVGIGAQVVYPGVAGVIQCFVETSGESPVGCWD